MIRVDASDYVPLAHFPLAWRFTDARWDLRGPAALRDVRPLTVTRAKSLCGPLSAACAATRDDASRHVPAPCESDADVQRVAAALAGLPIADGERLVLCWDERTALETSWQTFRQHWETFCYPGSDDLTVSPLDERWVLCYHHWEEFSFTARPEGPRP